MTALVNFIDKNTVISASWLNEVDVLKTTVFNSASTKTDAITALFSGVVAVAPSGGDDSATLNAAIATGKAVLFLPGEYLAHGLTQSTNFQRLIALGDVKIIKNANGDLFTSTGNDVELNGLGFRGESATPSFTGHNIVMSGDNPRLINCGSRWAKSRALLATGGRVEVIGTCDIYQTTDATATGYDIEIGKSGTATLYHKVFGITSTQNTGGIKFIDTGSHSVTDCQFGKYTVASGTAPAGSNGGKCSGNRILGAVSIGLSSANLCNNQFGAVAITFEVGTSGCSMDRSNVYANGCTITNNGNSNNLIEKQISTGTTGNEIRTGDDTSVASVQVDVTNGRRLFSGNVVVKNQKSVGLANTAGSETGAQLSMSAGDNFGINNNTSAKAIQITQVGAGMIQNIVNGAESIRADADTTATHTRFMLYDVDAGALVRVTVGAADSGGAGFKLLRVPN